MSRVGRPPRELKREVYQLTYALEEHYWGPGFPGPCQVLLGLALSNGNGAGRKLTTVWAFRKTCVNDHISGGVVWPLNSVECLYCGSRVLWGGDHAS
jgi:hypothetical protein